MKGEVIPFGQIAPNKLIEKALVGLEAEKDKFELHEIVTKVATSADHADMLICRSFTEPDKIKTISFWSDLDKPLFLPESPSSILDFIKISPLKVPDAASDIGQADLSRISFRGEKALVYYAEKAMKSGKVKFALIQQFGKRFEIYELLSGAKPKFNMPTQLYSRLDVDRNKARLARLGYKEKQLPQQAK